MSKKNRFIVISKSKFFLFTFLLLTFNSYAVTDNKIDFVSALNHALISNPQITASKAKVDAAQAMGVRARATGLPNINLESGFERGNNPMFVFGSKLSQGKASFADFGFDQYAGPSSINVVPNALNKPGYYNNFNAAVSVNVPLFQGGGHIAVIKQAKALINAAKHGDQYAKTELIYAVLQSYEGVRAAIDIIDVLQKSKEAAVKYLKMTKLLLKQSAVIESDVLMAENNLRAAKIVLEMAVAEKNNQLDAFRILIGKPRADFIPGSGVQLIFPNRTDEEFINLALNSNREIMALQSQVDASRAAVTAAKAHHLPRVDLHIRHDRNGNTEKLSKASSAAMVKMSWQLFSSGEQTGAADQAAAMQSGAIANINNAKNNIRLAVIKLLRSIEIADQQIKTTDISKDKTISVVMILSRRYGQGVVHLGQILDAQSRLETIRSQEIMARYNKMMAQARLLAIINELNIKRVQ